MLRYRFPLLRMTLPVLAAVAMFFTLLQSIAAGESEVSAKIDAFIEAAAKGQPIAPAADDGEFLRRVYLDFTGAIPTVADARAFLGSTASDKRAKLIDALIADERFPRRMADLFHVLLMERRGDHAEWRQYLLGSFQINKPWDQLVREILNPNPRDEATRSAAFFYTKRLEKEGEQPTDYPGLTRDVGRLFLGVDLQCAQCHNHLTVDDYKQADFQGLFAFYQNIAIHGGGFPAIAEKPMAKKIEFVSVFNNKPKETGPRVPTLPPEREIPVPAIEKGKEFSLPADAKTKAPAVPAFSPLSELARQLPTAENVAFSRNFVNRLWGVMMGRGLVHPFDLHHSKNPASHPEILDLLTQEFIARKFDTRWLIRELAMTKTYQRSSLLPSAGDAKEDRFTVAIERRLAPEQLFRSVLIATGEWERVSARKESKPGDDLPTFEDLRKRFDQSFAGEPKEPELVVEPSLKAALFLRNNTMLLSLLKPREGNLTHRLSQEKDDAKMLEELFLAVLSRKPTKEEQAELIAHLTKRAAKRDETIAQIAWAMLASAEFAVNH